MRNAVIAALALSLLVGLGRAPAARGVQDDDVAKAVAEEQAAKEKASQAAEEARQAREKVVRAERRALEKEIAAKEDEVDRLLNTGDAEGAGKIEAEVKVLVQKLSDTVFSRRLPVRMVSLRPLDAPAPSPSALTAKAVEGLPALQTRSEVVNENTVVFAALDWLARHQSPGGYWDCDGFSDQCKDGKCPGAGGPLYDPGVTGLASLAFLGAGETHKSQRHGSVLRNSLKYLKGIQDAEGCFGPRTTSHFTYNHALAAIAMSEAYGMTQSPLFKDSAQKGADFVLKCQNPYLGWRYGVRPQDNDTAMTGWMVMALKSSKMAGLTVDDAGFRGALAWLDKVTDPDTGRAGYTARGNGPDRPHELMAEALTAEAILTRMFCGADKGDEMVRKGADLCLKSLPAWDPEAGSIDYFYWYFGTVSMFQTGGEHWRQWGEALRNALWSHQRWDGDGCARGSWDPVDAWGPDGGRVYSTALGAMMTEVWFRYPRASADRK